ncbi:MAG: hypothetical protein ACR2M3_21085 [Thermomicrobiales bacterium]
MNGLQVVILGAALFCYMLYRQCARRPVTRGDLLIPGIGALYLGTRYLGGASFQIQNAVIVLVAALIGVGTGLLCGQMIRVWRDQESGIVYQYGGWPYAVAFLSLLIVRIAMRVVVRQWDFGTSAAILNDAFIGMMVGNFLGRAVNVGARALALLGWQFDALPHTQRARRARRSM